MSKLSFRARALDAAKPMPIYMTEELPDLPDYSAINRAVPQMPSGMEKEEECEHHLQRAICTGLIIPTPEVTNIEDNESYDRLYNTTYKMPRQLIHMQPFAMEQDIPEYDMDSEDEKFVNSQAKKMDLTPLKFEEMMDRLEKGSGQTVVTLQEAKGLLKEDDDLIIAVYDYWLNKRLKTVVPLIPMVKTEHRIGSAANNPYLAFRRRTEKMQTRKNRKNDETSYEKMLKLRRDLTRTVTLLELVKRREKTKREHLHLTIEIFEKRYQAQDFSGQLLTEVSAIKTPRPAFAPIFSNQFGLNQQHWLSKVVPIKEEILHPRKEKRQYKRRKHKTSLGGVISRGSYLMSSLQGSQNAVASSEEELESTRPEFSDVPQCDSEGLFSFRRKFGCSYLPPTSGFGNWPWCSQEDNGGGDKRFRYHPTSIATPRMRHIGLARKRLGRGGRVILDRTSGLTDEFWSSNDFKVFDNQADQSCYRPKTPPETCETWTNSDSENAVESLPNTLIIDVENLDGCGTFNSFHTADDEQSCSDDNSRNERLCEGGKKGNDEGVKSEEPECNSGSEVTGRTRTVQDDNEGCVSSWFRSARNCVRTNGDVGQRNHFYDRRKTDNNLSFNSISDLNRPGKHFFRRNYRIGGFKNINFRRKRKAEKDQEKEKDKEEQNVFTTTEISLPELFAECSVNLIPEAELETSDDSLAILDKLGLDDDFIKKEPEISLDVDKSDVLIKTDTGQNLTDNNSNTFQKQRLKVDKNIFEFSETDFLKYETDFDLDDLLTETVQNDVVGCCGLFGLTPNSRFNLVMPTYLPLESDKVEADQLEEEIEPADEKPPPAEKKSEFGQIANVASGSSSSSGGGGSGETENQQAALQITENRNSGNNILTSRLSLKNDFPAGGYQVGNGENLRIQPQQQAMNDIYALNHHNYTISGPPSYNFKQTENTQKTESGETAASTTTATTNSGYVSSSQLAGNNIQGQVTRQKGNRLSSAAAAATPTTSSTATATMGFTKLSSLSGARITHNLGHTTINHDPSGAAMQTKVNVNNATTPGAATAGLVDSVNRNIKHEETVKHSNHDGPGILRTYRGNNTKNLHVIADGSFVAQDPSRKISNGPATIGFNQKRILRKSGPQQQVTASISAQNPTVTQLVTTPSMFTIEGISTNQNFVLNQSFMTSANQNANYITGQTVSYVTANQNVLGKQVTVPQRKVSLLVNPGQAVPGGEPMDVELGNESLETIDIETSEGDESEEQSSSQEITVDNKKQMNVRKNNSLPMEVT